VIRLTPRWRFGTQAGKAQKASYGRHLDETGALGHQQDRVDPDEVHRGSEHSLTEVAQQPRCRSRRRIG
jgi:hypothetical protein